MEQILLSFKLGKHVLAEDRAGRADTCGVETYTTEGAESVVEMRFSLFLLIIVISKKAQILHIVIS